MGVDGTNMNPNSQIYVIYTETLRPTRHARIHTHGGFLAHRITCKYRENINVRMQTSYNKQARSEICSFTYNRILK